MVITLCASITNHKEYPKLEIQIKKPYAAGLSTGEKCLKPELIYVPVSPCKIGYPKNMAGRSSIITEREYKIVLFNPDFPTFFIRIASLLTCNITKCLIMPGIPTSFPI
jgi:hypothetical protein